jgi:hypothetical protein
MTAPKGMLEGVHGASRGVNHELAKAIGGLVAPRDLVSAQVNGGCGITSIRGTFSCLKLDAACRRDSSTASQD